MVWRQHHGARGTHHHHLQTQMRSRMLRGVSDFSEKRRLKKAGGGWKGGWYIRQIVSFR